MYQNIINFNLSFQNEIEIPVNLDLSYFIDEDQERLYELKEHYFEEVKEAEKNGLAEIFYIVQNYVNEGYEIENIEYLDYYKEIFDDVINEEKENNPDSIPFFENIEDLM